MINFKQHTYIINPTLVQETGWLKQRCAANQVDQQQDRDSIWTWLKTTYRPNSVDFFISTTLLLWFFDMLLVQGPIENGPFKVCDTITASLIDFLICILCINQVRLRLESMYIWFFQINLSITIQFQPLWPICDFPRFSKNLRKSEKRKNWGQKHQM